MFLLLSFIVAMMSLYYIGVIIDSYNADTTYLTPLVIMLIYSVYSMVREVRSYNWLGDENDTYNNANYGYYNDIPSGGYSNRYGSNYTYGGTHNRRPNVKIETFAPDKKEKADDTQELVHYPSKQEVRDKIKELEKSRWFRVKRDFASVFGVDITEKYYKAYKKSYKTNQRAKVDDNTRFMPKNNWYNQRETEEYNEVTKHMGRSCEIAFNEQEIENIEDGI